MSSTSMEMSYTSSTVQRNEGTHGANARRSITEVMDLTKVTATLGIVSALAAWTLASLTVMHLLSGHFETRTCQTECVQSYFFAAMAAGFAALVTGLVSAFTPRTKMIGIFALLLAIPLCVIFSVFLIGMVG